jgi:hypothetical protein
MLVGLAVSPGPDNGASGPKLDRAQAQAVLTTQCPPCSSCAMSSLLLPSHRVAEAAGARTGFCPAWGKRSPPRGPANLLVSPADVQFPPTPSSLTKAFICIWCVIYYSSLSIGRHYVPSCPFSLSSSPYPHSSPTNTPADNPGSLGALSFFHLPILLQLPLDKVTEPQNVKRAALAPSPILQMRIVRHKFDVLAKILLSLEGLHTLFQ